MSVSVVIPAYNAVGYLPQAIQSVKAQTIVDWELVVVDDGSKDATAMVAQGYVDSDHRIRVIRQANGGVAAARNRGFAETNCKFGYILFFDQDDVLEPQALETLSRSLSSDLAAVAAHGHGRYIDERGDLWQPGQAEALSQERRQVEENRLVPVPLDKPTTFATLVYLNCIWTPGQVMIRRSAFNSAGPFNQQVAPCDDWDMWLRLSYHGHIAAVNSIVLNIRRHTNNASHDMKAMRRAELAVRRGLLTLTQGNKQKRQLALAGYRRSELHFGSHQFDLAKKALARKDWLMSAKLMRHVAMFYARSVPGLPI